MGMVVGGESSKQDRAWALGSVHQEPEMGNSS